MFEQAVLRQLVQDLLDKTQDAEKAYSGLASYVSDPATREQVELLAREKHRHVLLAERLLEIVG